MNTSENGHIEENLSLVNTVKHWVTIDNQIRALNKKLRELRNDKKEQNEMMIQVMKQNNIDNFTLKDGQIQHKKQTTREPLNQKTLFTILAKHPQLDDEQAKHLNQFIHDSRSSKEKDVIVRKITDDN